MTTITEETQLIADILKAAGWKDTGDAQWENLQKILPQIELVFRTTPLTREDFTLPSQDDMNSAIYQLYAVTTGGRFDTKEIDRLLNKYPDSLP